MATTLQAKHQPQELLAPDTPSLVISRTEQGKKNQRPHGCAAFGP